VQGHLLLTNCIEDEVTRPAIELALKDDKLLWLDLADTGPDTIALLREVFKIHPLAIEDAQEFDQRPKVEDYDDFVYVVAYGARPGPAVYRGALLLRRALLRHRAPR
jgi:Mg2+ and Co2+ transporter CorA